jgi:hypothetical protein
VGTRLHHVAGNGDGWKKSMACNYAKLEGFGGAVAQLGARLDGIEEVEGSNPFGSTKIIPVLRATTPK